MTEDTLLGVSGLATVLDCSEKKARGLLDRGDIPSERAANKYRFCRRSAAEAYRSRQEQREAGKVAAA